MTIENSNTARYLNFDEDGIPIVQAKHMRNGELQVIASKSPVNNLAQLESNSVREVCLDFWTPVTRAELPAKARSFKYFLLKVGQLADRYAYLGSKQVQVTKDLNPDSKIYRVKVYEQDNSLTKTLIVASYFFTGSISFLIALAIKAIYKTYLNFVYERVETKRDLQVLPLTLDLPIEKVKEPAPMANTVVAQKKIGETLIVLSTGDLTLENADVIVNAANRSLLAGNGVCRAIHSRAGDSIFKECKTLLEQKNIKQIECGEAVVTTAGKMQQAKAVIHTAGPDCRVTAENGKRKELLKKAYLNSLLLAAGRHPNQKEWISSDYKNKNEPINSIAFPSISTGIFQYPLEEAVAIVFEALQEFIKEYPDALKEIRFVFLANNPEPKAYLSALDKISANT